MSESFELLSVVIDSNPLWWGKLLEENNDDRVHFFPYCLFFTQI